MSTNTTTVAEPNPLKTYLTLRKLMTNPSTHLTKMGSVIGAKWDEDRIQYDDEVEGNLQLGKIQKHIKNLTRDMPFAIGGRLELCEHDKHCVTLAITAGGGEVLAKQRLGEVDYDRVASLCVNSAFGKMDTGETVVDLAVRTGLELDAAGKPAPPANSVRHLSPNRAELKLDYPKDWPDVARKQQVNTALSPSTQKAQACAPFTTGKLDHPVFLQRIKHQLAMQLSPNTYLKLEPFKLMLYEKGGHFKPHKDSAVKDLVATLFVALPSEHTGGALAVRDSTGEEMVFDFAQHSADNSSVQWACFFPDCEHEVRVVESGRRVVFAYRVLLDRNPPSYDYDAYHGWTYPFDETFVASAERNKKNTLHGLSG